jgi:hypothetical protein
MAVAIPGERYLRLFDAVHRGTPEQQKEAKAFIKSAFKVDLDINYEMSASFTYDSSGKTDVYADIFAGSTPYVADVKAYVRNSLNPDPPISSSLPLPMSEEEIRTAIANLIHKNVLVANSYPSLVIGPINDSRLAPRPDFYVVGHKGWDDPKKGVAAMVGDFTDAILMVRGVRNLPVTSPHRSKPFLALRGLDYVFVLISKPSFESITAGELEKKFSVEINVHEAGHPDRPLHDKRPFVLRKADFLVPENPVVSHGTRGQFVWAVKQVTPYQSISEDTFKKLKEMREMADKVEKQLPK